MYKEFTRSINTKEKELLQERAKHTEPSVTALGTTKWLVLWVLVMILCVSVVMELVSNESLNSILTGIINSVFGIGAILSLYAIIQLISSYFHWSKHHREFINNEIPNIQSALNDEHVFVKHVEACDVIEILEYEDEGIGYIFDVGDNKTFFLKGQDYYSSSDDKPWPNSKFEIVSTVVGNQWIGIFCSGEALNPVKEIPSSDCKEDIVWRHREELVDNNIKDFTQSILITT